MTTRKLIWACLKGYDEKRRTVTPVSYTHLDVYKRQVLSIFMIVCGVLCVIFPVQAVLAAEILAAVVIITLGVYEIIEYFCEPGFLRQPMSLIGGVLNLIIGILLIFSPSQVTISTFAFLFGILLMVFRCV